MKKLSTLIATILLASTLFAQYDADGVYFPRWFKDYLWFEDTLSIGDYTSGSHNLGTANIKFYPNGTVELNALTGSGDIIGIDENNHLYRTEGSGSLTGLLTEHYIPFGAPDGSLDQSSGFQYNKDSYKLTITGSPNNSYLNAHFWYDGSEKPKVTWKVSYPEEAYVAVISQDSIIGNIEGYSYKIIRDVEAGTEIAYIKMYGNGSGSNIGTAFFYAQDEMEIQSGALSLSSQLTYIDGTELYIPSTPGTGSFLTLDGSGQLTLSNTLYQTTLISSDQVSASSTEQCGISGSGNWAITVQENRKRTYMTHDGEFVFAGVGNATAQPGDGGLVITLYKNGVATSMVLTIAAGTSANSYTTYNSTTVSFSAGDYFNWYGTNSSASNSALLNSIVLKTIVTE